MDIGLTMHVCVVRIDDTMTEPLQVSNVGGGEYFVESIPFVTDKVSRCDLIAVDDVGGTFFFSERLSASGHRTVSVQIEDRSVADELSHLAQKQGLLMEQNESFGVMAIDIPVKYDPKALVEFLDSETKKHRLEYTIR